jgi:hypothetical protein
MDARVATAPRWNGAPQAAPLTIRRNDANNSAHLAGPVAGVDSVARASSVLFLPEHQSSTRGKFLRVCPAAGGPEGVSSRAG